jgi:hypothetical protein
MSSNDIFKKEIYWINVLTSDSTWSAQVPSKSILILCFNIQLQYVIFAANSQMDQDTTNMLKV